MPQPVTIPYIRVTDNDGNPATGAKMWFYLSETTILGPVYANAAHTVELSNPVISGENGIGDGVFPLMFLDLTLAYRVRVTDKDDNPLAPDVEPFYGQDPAITTVVADAAANAIAAIIPYVDQAEAAAAQADIAAALATSNGAAAVAAIQSALAIGAIRMFGSTADALSNGVVGYTITAAGAGGTDGSYFVAPTGGGGSGAGVSISVVGGAVADTFLRQQGKNYTSAPTVPLGGIPGLAGATVTATYGANTVSGDYFLTPNLSISGFNLYLNTAGAAILQFTSNDSLDNVIARLDAAGIPQVYNYEAESKAYFLAVANAGVTQSARRKYMFDRWVKKLKAGGVFSALRGWWIMGNSSAESCINIASPGVYNLVPTGGPTFTDMKVATGGAVNETSTGMGYRGFSNTVYLDTGIPLNSITHAHSFAQFVRAPSNQGTSLRSAGCLDGANGISLGAGTFSTPPVCRALGAEFACPGTGTSAGDYDGLGIVGYNRVDDANVEVWHNSIKVGTVANAYVAPTTANTLYIGKANGSSNAQANLQRAAWLTSRALTDDEWDLLYRATRSLIESIHWGDVLINEAGYGPVNPSADVVVYGWTWQGWQAAYEARRQGLTVLWVGGYDEHSPQHIGGMSAGGLGYADINNATALGGLAKTIFTRLIAAGEGSGITFTPRGMNWMLRQMCDPSRTSAQDIELYESNGVLAVAKTGARITSITCADGRTYSADYFHDYSYESDLMALAGVDYTVGQEAAGADDENYNGWRGGRGDNIPLYGQANIGGVLLTVDPFVTPGVPASGLIAKVNANPMLAVGAATGYVQEYSFRQTWTNQNSKMKPVAASAPPGYDAADYEALGRLFQAAADASLVPIADDIIKISSVSARNIFDINSRSIVSNDLHDSGNRYAACATYAQRRALKAILYNEMNGWQHYLRYDADSRIPAGVRATLMGYGLSVDHYLDPGPDDQVYTSWALYIREFRRLVGDEVWDLNDLNAADGTVPRDTQTVTCASYNADSHTHFNYADDSSGTYTIWGANNIFVAGCGPNNLAPVPRKVFLPKKAQCENLFVGFGASCTHAAFGIIRMELTSAQAAQSGAMLTAIAIENGLQALHDVDDATFRTRMAALPDAVPAYLPQVN